jgi:hypothetical protein
MSFSLKAIFALMSFCAVVVVLCMKAGPLVTLGLVVSAAVLYWTIRSKRSGWFLIPRIAAGIFSLVVMWFLAVEWSWHYRECSVCRSRYDYEQYRIAGFEVFRREYPDQSIYEKILTDLGDPCDHQTVDGFHEQRFWGLIICAYPCENGMYGWGAGGEYSQESSAFVKAVAITRPELSEEIREHLAKEDMLYVTDALLTDMHAVEDIKESDAEDAIEWLRGGTKELPRQISQLTATESLDLVQQLYDAGAVEVWAVKPEYADTSEVGDLYTLAEDEERGVYGNFHQDNKYVLVCRQLLVKLPADSKQRKQIITLCDSLEDVRVKYPTQDGGQEYLSVYVDE